LASVALASGGCASSALDADLRQVSTLAHTEPVTRLVDGDVAAAGSDDARRLLAAPLDAEQAVRVALLENRELRARLRELGVQRGRLIQAGLLPNPRAEAELLPERNTQIELRVEFDITSALLAPFRARAAQSELDAARSRVAGAVIELGYRVRVGYYALQGAEQRLAFAQQQLDASAAARDAARAMHDAGNLPELVLTSQEAAHERTRITVAQLELEVAMDRERLQRLLGLHGTDTAWRLAGSLPPAPEATAIGEKFEARVLGKNLELLETRQRLEALARRAGFTRTAGWIPDITLDVHALHGNPNVDPSAAPDEELRFGAGVNLALPLFDRGQGTAVALEAEFDALLERYYGLAVDVRSRAREAEARVVSSHARSRQYQTVIVPLQHRVMEQTLLQYNAMQIGIFQVLDARRAELDVQLAYVDTLREYWSAEAELAALLAGQSVAAAMPATPLASDGAEGKH